MTPRLLPAFCGGLRPTAAQRAFLCADDNLEAFFAGSSGIGKSVALCFAALQYADQRDYRALILRPRLSDFARTDQILSTLDKMLRGSGATYNTENFTWSFSSGAKVLLAFAKKLEDVGNIQGASFQFIGYDELPLFPESVYTWSFSRARSAGGSSVPLRIRGSATPPEDASGAWFTERFITHRPPGCIVIPATTGDNPHLDKSQLAAWAAVKDRDRAVYERQYKANWFFQAEGISVFKASDFPVTPDVPASFDVLCRGYDLAGTDREAKDKSGRKFKDRADHTVGTLVGWSRKTGVHFVLDSVFGQWSVSEVDRRIVATAERDGKSVLVAVEQAPGNAGKAQVQHLRELLPGYHLIAIPARASKVQRSVEVQRYSQDGLLKYAAVCPGRTLALDQIVTFPAGKHEDFVDSLVTAIAGIHAKKQIAWDIL